jgi:RNA polymerase sigma factor (sigma-70 family)
MPDPSQLAAWFDAHAGAMVLYARQWLTDRAAAEDVVQEVFVRLMSGPGSQPNNPRAWLFAAVRNAAIDAARSESRRKVRERSATPFAWFEKRHDDLLDAEAVQRAVAQLPPRQREVVTLRVWSDMTLNEISQVVGIAISTVHDEYRRGLDAVRQLMEKPCSKTTTTRD